MQRAWQLQPCGCSHPGSATVDLFTLTPYRNQLVRGYKGRTASAQADKMDGPVQDTRSWFADTPPSGETCSSGTGKRFYVYTENVVHGTARSTMTLTRKQDSIQLRVWSGLAQYGSVLRLAGRNVALAKPDGDEEGSGATLSGAGLLLGLTCYSTYNQITPRWASSRRHARRVAGTSESTSESTSQFTPPKSLLSNS